MILWLVLLLLLALPAAAHAQPTVDQVLTDMQLSDGDKQKVLNGEFVTASVPAVSDRDLSFAIAFLVKTSPEALAKQVMAGDLVTADAQVQTFGELKGAGTVAEFAKLKITPDEVKALSTAKAGEALNLSAAEIAAFEGVRSGGAAAVQQQLHKMLLARYQAYRASGLAGIAAYDRGGGRTTDHAADLRKAAESTQALKKYVPGFQIVLVGFPKASLTPQMRESFFWMRSVIEGKPTYVLTHVLAASDGGNRVLARRQYYASTGYNGEQSVAGFLPAQGGTVVVFVSHAFTDQVTGFGGSIKRGIGSKVMAGKMKDIFEAGRKKAVQ